MPFNRALIADDHIVVRAGMKTILKEMRPFIEVDEATNGDKVIEYLKHNEYDIIVLDVNMPDTDAIALVTNVFAYREKSRVLMFSMNSENLYAKRFMKLGVLGYLEKEATAEEIRNALGHVLGGTTYMSEGLKRLFFDEMMTNKKENPFERLSNREIQIAKYLLKGLSAAEIQKILNLHSSTIGTHKTRTFEKLNVRNLFELRELADLYQVDLSRI